MISIPRRRLAPTAKQSAVMGNRGSRVFDPEAKWYHNPCDFSFFLSILALVCNRKWHLYCAYTKNCTFTNAFTYRVFLSSKIIIHVSKSWKDYMLFFNFASFALDSVIPDLGRLQRNIRERKEFSRMCECNQHGDLEKRESTKSRLINVYSLIVGIGHGYEVNIEISSYSHSRTCVLFRSDCCAFVLSE